MASEILVPNSDVDLTYWAGGYTEIDETIASADDDSTVSTCSRSSLNSGACTAEFGLTDTTITTVLKVTTRIRARYDGGTAVLNYWAVINGSPVASGTANLTGGGHATFTTDETGSWTQSQVNAATFHYELASGDTPGTNYCNVTAAEMEVYDTAGGPPPAILAASRQANVLLNAGENAMQKNVSGQKIGAQLTTAADGTDFTGSVTVYVTGDAGTQAVGSVGSGACTHEGNGYHTYAPSQAETNYDHIAFTFTGSGAVSATVQVYTSVNAVATSLGTQAKADVNAEVLDVLTVDTFAQPGQESPAATTTIGKMMAYLYKAWRNRHTQTASEYALYADDGTTKDQEAAVSDNGTTFDRSEISTGA